MTLAEIENQIAELEKQKAVIKEKERVELLNKEKERYEEVVEAFNHYAELRDKYYADYGNFPNLVFPNLTKLFF